MFCAPSWAPRRKTAQIGDRTWLAALIMQLPVANGRYGSGPYRQPWHGPSWAIIRWNETIVTLDDEGGYDFAGRT